eukprot:s2559_g11.t1
MALLLGGERSCQGLVLVVVVLRQVELGVRLSMALLVGGADLEVRQEVPRIVVAGACLHLESRRPVVDREAGLGLCSQAVLLLDVVVEGKELGLTRFCLVLVALLPGAAIFLVLAVDGRFERGLQGPVLDVESRRRGLGFCSRVVFLLDTVGLLVLVADREVEHGLQELAVDAEKR